MTTACWVVGLLALAVAPWCLRREVPTRAVAPRVRVRFWWQRRRPEPRVDPAVALDILAAAISAGAPIPVALGALGAAMPPAQGVTLSRAAAVLELGGEWEAAWQGAGQDLAPIARSLGPAWSDGVAPGDLLEQAAATIRSRRLGAAKDAAARLGVRLVLPMGVCLLPAFVLLGIVPVLLSAGGALLF